MILKVNITRNSPASIPHMTHITEAEPELSPVAHLNAYTAPVSEQESWGWFTHWLRRSGCLCQVHMGRGAARGGGGGGGVLGPECGSAVEAAVAAVLRTGAERDGRRSVRPPRRSERD